MAILENLRNVRDQGDLPSVFKHATLYAGVSFLTSSVISMIARDLGSKPTGSDTLFAATVATTLGACEFMHNVRELNPPIEDQIDIKRIEKNLGLTILHL